MSTFSEKIKNLYCYEEWDFTILYGFSVNFNHLMKPYSLPYEHFEKKLHDFNNENLNGESKILQKKFLDKILDGLTEKDFLLNNKKQ